LKAPSWFLRELESFDPDLRLRWSPRLEFWQIERRVKRGLHPGTIRNDGWHDDYIRAADGYILVASVTPEMFQILGRSIFQRLKDSDLWARGGWEKVASEIEAAEHADEEKKWESFGAEVRYSSAELFNFLKHRNGQSIYAPGAIA
jgi:hypothetical protein